MGNKRDLMLMFFAGHIKYRSNPASCVLGDGRGAGGASGGRVGAMDDGRRDVDEGDGRFCREGREGSRGGIELKWVEMS
jgi:hypothetical protein